MKSVPVISNIDLPPTNLETEITLKEASKGTTCSLTVKDPAICLDCVNIEASKSRQCLNCRGLGYLHIYRQVEVELPPQVYVGQEIRYPGLGRYNLCAAKNSDLIVKIKICQHPYLELAGKNITCTLVVSFFEALLGKKLTVPTASGKTNIKLSPLTRSGKVYRLKGLGLGGGDQLITIEVWPAKT